jgi:hypothetical protein
MSKVIRFFRSNLIYLGLLSIGLIFVIIIFIYFFKNENSPFFDFAGASKITLNKDNIKIESISCGDNNTIIQKSLVNCTGKLPSNYQKPEKNTVLQLGFVTGKTTSCEFINENNFYCNNVETPLETSNQTPIIINTMYFGSLNNEFSSGFNIEVKSLFDFDNSVSLAEDLNEKDIKVKINSKPKEDIIIEFKHYSKDITINNQQSAKLIFNEGNWQNAQTFKVGGVIDSIDEGDEIVEIQSLVINKNYENIKTNAIKVLINDDDKVGININTDTVLDMYEQSSTRKIGISLQSEPEEGDIVVLNIALDNKKLIEENNQNRLNFTKENWDILQFVTLKTVDNNLDLDEKTEFFVTVNQEVSTSAAYRSKTIEKKLLINLIDNDTGGVKTDTQELFFNKNQETKEINLSLKSDLFDDEVVKTKINSSLENISISSNNIDFRNELDVDFIKDTLNFPIKKIYVKYNGQDSNQLLNGYINFETVDSNMENSIYDGLVERHKLQIPFALQSVSQNYINIENTNLQLLEGQEEPITSTISLKNKPLYGERVELKLEFDPTKVSINNSINSPYFVVFENQNQLNKINIKSINNDIIGSEDQLISKIIISTTQNTNITDLIIPEKNNVSISIKEDDKIEYDITLKNNENIFTNNQYNYKENELSEIYVTLKKPIKNNIIIKGISDKYELKSAEGNNSVVLNESNWNIKQPINIKTKSNSKVSGEIDSFFFILSQDSKVINLSQSFGIINNINEKAEVKVESINLNNDFDTENTISEKGDINDALRLKLTTKPIQPIFVKLLNYENNIDFITEDQVVKIDESNWNTGVKFAFKSRDNNIDQNSEYNSKITYKILTNDPEYKKVKIPDSIVKILDNDESNLNIYTDNVKLEEATDKQKYIQVSLKSEPKDLVKLNVKIDNTQLLFVDKNVTQLSLEFDSKNWNIPQNITLGVLDDNLLELPEHSGNVSFSLETKDTEYLNSMYIKNLNISIIDNEKDQKIQTLESKNTNIINIFSSKPEVVITSVDNVMDEQGGSAKVYFTLNSEPETQVNIPVDISDKTEANLLGVKQVSIEPRNWNNPKTNFVIIKGLDDSIQDGDKKVILKTDTPITSDTNYKLIKGGDIADVELINKDNDKSGIVFKTVDEISTENGDTAEFTIKLATRPISPIILKLKSSDTAEIKIPENVVITPEEWIAPKSVIITGLDDTANDGNKNITIGIEDIITDDPNYKNILSKDIQGVIITNQDNEGVQVFISSTTQQLSESGDESRVTFDLSKQPEDGADVIIPIAISGVEGEIITTNPTQKPLTINGNAESTLLFKIKNKNWNKKTSNTIIIKGLNDSNIDGENSFKLTTGTTESKDILFNGIDASDIADLTFTTTDNDKDSDGDCSTNEQEYLDGTNAKDNNDYKDSDGDEVPDGLEVYQETNFNDIVDYKDTDSDKVPDCVESREGTDFQNQTSFLDIDGDGISSYEERIQAIKKIYQNSSSIENSSAPRTNSQKPNYLIFVLLGISSGTTVYFVFKYARRKIYGKR